MKLHSVVRNLFRSARTWLSSDRGAVNLLRPARESFGADLNYARELHRLAQITGYLSEEEEQEQEAVDREIAQDVAALDAIEHTTLSQLDALWRRTCEQLQLDSLDIEWAMLATGELVTV